MSTIKSSFYIYAPLSNKIERARKGYEMDFKEKIISTIKNNNLIENGDKIVLGVSGGPDSISMLNVLYTIMQEKSIDDFDIVVAHVNHGLRENAKIDEEYVKEYCKKKNIDCHVLHANIKEEAQNLKRGLEDTGRIIRYKFFDEVAKKTGANKIAISQNTNDRVETIIMNIMRGTGLEGLKGIEVRNANIIRPLLFCSRDEIEKYCEAEELNPRYDESNDQNEYTRNKIRNIVLPFVKKEFNPNIEESIIRLSDIATESIEWIDIETNKNYEEIVITKSSTEIVLNRKIFNSKNKMIQKRVILMAIKELFGSTQGIEKIHIDDVIKLCNNNIGNKYLTPNKNTKVELVDKQIKISKIENHSAKHRYP